MGQSTHLPYVFLWRPPLNGASRLVAPHIPSRRTAAGKKFDSGDIAHQPDDAAAGFLRFLAVFLDVGHNHLMYPGIGTFRVPSGGKQTDLGVCPRPVTHAGEQGGRIPVLLHPNESDGFIGKSPGIQHRPRLFQQGKRHPKEQGTVLCGQ